MDKKIKLTKKLDMWIEKLITGGAKFGCALTYEYGKKRSLKTWRSTGSGIIDMMLWTVLHLKVSANDLIARFFDVKPWYP